MKLFSDRKRPVHWGPYAMERLARVDAADLLAWTGLENDAIPEPASEIGAIARDYLNLFGGFRHGDVAEARAPIPDDPRRLSEELLSAAYFLDAAVAGICELGPEDWKEPLARDAEVYGVVVVVQHGRQPEEGGLAHSWTRGSDRWRSSMRAAEIACILAGYVRRMGFAAVAHTEASSDVRLKRLAVKAGLAVQRDGGIENPFLGTEFALAGVTTELPLTPGRPLASSVKRVRGISIWLGLGGVRSGFEQWRRRRRQSDLGSYPMEKIGRASHPTTLLLEDEIPRVPMRAQFFHRARSGDLGEKMRHEGKRFSTKHPLAHAMRPLFRAMVPLQQGDVSHKAKRASDAAENAKAIKSLAYYLDADMVGICEAPGFVWYSHDQEGEPLEPEHPRAIVILVDQGHETMEAASGDDWISGVQSMRAYVRGAEIAGHVAALIRSQGYRARSHTNVDSLVLHIPLILLAGLGELSRIGELVLNPFLGARFKSVVVTTDMPLRADAPIDFGLQDMCAKCFKCARECPVGAISHGDKVMFNGYEMWKPDVERCTRYRVSNPNGSACGRCMKMCPFTNEGLLLHRVFLWIAMKVPFSRRSLARLDDWIGHGKRNLLKKWWHDLEWLNRGDNGISVAPRRVNARDLNLNLDGSEPPKRHPPIAYHHADMMPPPASDQACPVSRRAGLEAAKLVETPAEAKRRRERGGPSPAHYRPRRFHV